MQGSCKHDKRGSNCLFPHPPMYFKFIGKGSKGCDKRSLCTYGHPKLCQASVSNHRCNKKICHFYHVSGSLRPNHHGTALEKRSVNKLDKRHPLTPLMQIKLPVPEKKCQPSTPHPIPYTQVNQPNPVLLSSPPFPFIKYSHIMHTFPLHPYNNLALMFLGQLRDMKHPRCCRHKI